MQFNVTDENVEVVVMGIANLTEESGELHARDIDNAASILTDVVSVISESENITTEVLEEVNQ